MFKIINKFIKETLVAFYIYDNRFFAQKQITKNGQVLEKEDFEFSKEEFLEFIQNCFVENTQTYVSTIIPSFNQGVVDSCSHSKYKELGIHIDNIKILCLKNYSIFIGLYELNAFIKEMQEYKVDFIFSPYLIIDIYKTDTKNCAYLLVTKQFLTIIIYNNDKPSYNNIHIFQNEDNLTEDNLDNSIHHIDDDIGVDDDIIDDIEDIEELDDIGSLDDDLDDIEDINNLEDIEEPSTENVKEEIINTKNELEILEFLKTSIKDYYDNYSSDFLENLIIIHTEPINLVESIQNELLLEAKTKEINLLEAINSLALKELNV